MNVAQKRKFDRLARAWLTGLRAARGRVGEAPGARLSWLLGFAELSCDQIHRWSEAKLMEVGLEVLSFAEGARMNITRASGGVGQNPDEAMAGHAFKPDEIAHLAEAVTDAVSKLWGPQPDRVGWLFEPSAYGSLRRAIQAQTFRSYYSGDFRPAFLMAVADLLSTEGRRVAHCAECGRLFVRRKRGAYCSSGCSQKARTTRYRESLGRDEWYRRRHKHYVHLVERKQGKKVAARVRMRLKHEGSEQR